jgi:hypothetical protein
VINRQVCDRLRLCKTKIHCHGVLTFCAHLQCAPEGDVRAGGAEVILKIWTTDIGLSLACRDDPFVLVAICPKATPSP